MSIINLDQELSNYNESSTTVLSSRSAGSAIDARLADFKINDSGNARRLVERYGNDLRYCSSQQSWMVWDGEIWQTDGAAQAMKRAKSTVSAIDLEADSIAIDTDDGGKDRNLKRRQKLLDWGIASGMSRGLSAMLTVAETEDEIEVTADQLDANPILQTFLNGTLNLQTGTLMQHRREDMTTKMTRITYDPDAVCPIWDAFLVRILPDAEVRGYVQRMAGYMLTGLTGEQCLFFLFGGGDNGKTTFVNMLEKLTGDYFGKTRAETIMQKRENEASNDIAALVGKRLVSVAEIGAGQRLNESLIKDVTGDDLITARFLHKEFFTYRPQFKILMFGNHMPDIKGTDKGIWRRLKLINFDQTISSKEKDTDLGKKLQAELSGILNWALQGCYDWFENGLQEPGVITDAINGYKFEMDPIAQWMDDNCRQGTGYTVQSSILYTNYSMWCKDQGLSYVQSNMALSKKLLEKGFKKMKSAGVMIWSGISV